MRWVWLVLALSGCNSPASGFLDGECVTLRNRYGQCLEVCGTGPQTAHLSLIECPEAKP